MFAGWHFCRLLRSREYLPLNNIPIAVVSATLSGDEPAHIAAALGVEGFLPMPVEGEIFVRLIKDILGRKDALKPLRALIVEADAAWADHLKQSFDSHGYLADIARTHAAAVEMLDRVGYDLAVMDHESTDDAEAGLIEAFTRKHPDAVLIMTTSHSDPELAVQWMKQGVAAHLHKPCAAEYLIDQCKRARRERTLMRMRETLEGAVGKLLENERLHRGILHTAMDGYWLSDSRGRLLEVNEAYCRMSGYDEQELLSMTVSDLDDVESAEVVLEHKETVKKLVSFRQACVKKFNYVDMIGYQLNREDNQWKSRAHRQQALKKFSSDLRDGVRRRNEERPSPPLYGKTRLISAQTIPFPEYAARCILTTMF